METEKLIKILENVEDATNSDLKDALNILDDEFENTKQLLLKLTTHLDVIEENYNKIKEEIEKRKK